MMAISAFRTRGDLPTGMSRIMWLGRDIETGFSWESWVDWPDEKLTPEPADQSVKRGRVCTPQAHDVRAQGENKTVR